MRTVKNGKIKWTHTDGRVEYYPVAEATEPLIFMVEVKDVSKARKLNGYADPNCCVAACALRRQYCDAIFQRDTAYILATIGGKVYARRHRFGSSLRKAISVFDSGGTFPPGMYQLKPISFSQTLEAKRERAKNPSLTSRTVRPHIKFNARGKVTPLS